MALEVQAICDRCGARQEVDVSTYDALMRFVHYTADGLRHALETKGDSVTVLICDKCDEELKEGVAEQ